MTLSIRNAVVLASAAAAILSVAGIVPAISSAFAQQHLQDKQQMTQMHGHGAGHTKVAVPSMPGQDAFGAVQEIVRILEADPATDWSKINLEALRQHLIDMNELVLKADAVATPIDGGVEIAVTGAGRTLAAIQRMLPAWAGTMNGYKGWATKVTSLPNGERLAVTAVDPKEVAHVRGLGFIGLIASGAHHQPHHLAMARGKFGHQH